MDIICPVIETDFDRFLILMRTLKKFYRSEYRIFLVSPTGTSPTKDKKVIPIKDEKLSKCLTGIKCVDKGWWKQQVIKLLSHKLCDTDTIMVLDADCIAVRPFVDKNLLISKKIRTCFDFHESKPNQRSYSNWYTGSSHILGLPHRKMEDFYNVTPTILSKNILKALEEYLINLYGMRFAEYLLRHVNTNGNGNWTEYTLYHIFAENSGSFNKYHTIDPNFMMYDNCVWFEDQLETWSAKKSFENPDFFFSVLQSTSKYDPKWLISKIDEYL